MECQYQRIQKRTYRTAKNAAQQVRKYLCHINQEPTVHGEGYDDQRAGDGFF